MTKLLDPCIFMYMDTATPAQIKLIARILGYFLVNDFIKDDIEMGLYRDHSDILGFDVNVDLGTITKDEASKMIGTLKACGAHKMKPRTDDELDNLHIRRLAM